MRCITPVLTALALLLTSAAASAQGQEQQATAPSPYRTLQALDGQLAAIGYRLTTANAPLCTQLDPATGLLWQDSDQYHDRAAIAGIFAFETPVEVAAVVPGSPAALADIRPGDAFLAIEGAKRIDLEALGTNSAEDPYLRIRRLSDALAEPSLRSSSDGSVKLDLMRAGTLVHKTINPVPACATKFQIRVEDGLEAGADGQMVSVNLPLVQYALTQNEGELAAIVAHELAHNILRHKDRLDAVHVDRGIARMFGKNARRIKATEEEADRLSVWLLVNAGFDPEDAIHFWTRFGQEHGHGIFTEGTHYRWKNRVEQLRQELAALPQAQQRDGVKLPPILNAPLPSLE